MIIILAFFLSSCVLLLSKLARESVELSQGNCEKLPGRLGPACGSRHLIKNGSVHQNKPKHQLY